MTGYLEPSEVSKGLGVKGIDILPLLLWKGSLNTQNVFFSYISISPGPTRKLFTINEGVKRKGCSSNGYVTYVRRELLYDIILHDRTDPTPLLRVIPRTKIRTQTYGLYRHFNLGCHILSSSVHGILGLPQDTLESPISELNIGPDPVHPLLQSTPRVPLT